MADKIEVRVEFDLQPAPRILVMLGEINLPQAKCLAELVDNSVDGFLQAKRTGTPIERPEVHISIPGRDTESAQVTVRDNGPGMSPQTLQWAVKAGWSGNNPIESLGLFGMGFNIATARLGYVTEVWTTRKEDAEWHGLRIDFDMLQRQGHFRTPHLTRPKVDSNERGTEVVVRRLKPEQRSWLSKTANQTKIKAELRRIYSSMLRTSGVPISFSLSLNGSQLQGFQHCVWGEGRVVQSSRYGEIGAFQPINVSLGERLFCLKCWTWAAAQEDKCPDCRTKVDLVRRERRVYGWLGIQRYLHATEFGIDLIRNGRKIEIGNKDLFVWRNDNEEEREYPIDDPRNRGRIVGEIHLDHCRVTYTKDRFDRTDPTWEEMLQIVCGVGPLRPDKARDLGYSENRSPLSLLFQAFRRSTPKPKSAGAWANLLVVNDNDKAVEMAKKFHDGDPEFRDDTKWFELVEEEDRKLLFTGAGTTPAPAAGGTPPIPGFGGGGETPAPTPGPGGAPAAPAVPASPEPAPPPPRNPVPSLCGEFRHEGTGLRWEVRCWSVSPGDPELGTAGAPWRLKANASGPFDFYVDVGHDVFRSATFSPTDALMAQLAHSAMDLSRHAPTGTTFATVLRDLRERYSGTTKLDPFDLSNDANRTLRAIAKSLPRQVDREDSRALYEELSSEEQEEILKKMAKAGLANFQDAVNAGRFLEFAPPRTILDFFLRHPNLFLDGKYWENKYEGLDFGRPAATEEARAQVVRYFETLMSDAVWLADQDPTQLFDTPKARLQRAALALELLEPASPTEE